MVAINIEGAAVNQLALFDCGLSSLKVLQPFYMPHDWLQPIADCTIIIEGAAANI